jgi:small subunit ribosomal protein S35
MHYQGAPPPANRKSVLTVSLPDLYAHSLFTSLPNDSTRIRTLRKLLHLAGPRWNPGKGSVAEPLRLDGKYGEDVAVRGEIKISCEKFPTERQNMKWCSDVFDEMIKEAQVSKAVMVEDRDGEGEERRRSHNLFRTYLYHL